MIVSASYRTDIPAFYSDWLRCRLRAGYCDVANPYGGGIHRVSLLPEAVEGFVLWTRNLRPLLPYLGEVGRVAPFVVQFTITGYPRSLESSVVAPADAVGQLREVRRRFGPRAAVWRYDPIVFTAERDAAAHAEGFAVLARDLAGTVDEVVLSVMHPYRKTRRNLDRAAARFDFAWHDPPAEEKRALLVRLAAIAQDHGITPTLCSQPGSAGAGDRRGTLHRRRPPFRCRPVPDRRASRRQSPRLPLRRFTRYRRLRHLPAWLRLLLRRRRPRPGCYQLSQP